MVKMERPGVDAQWERSWKGIVRNWDKVLAGPGPKFVQHLEEYVSQGFVAEELESNKLYPVDPVQPPYFPWESSYISGALAAGGLHPFEFEKRGMEGVFDTRLAAHAFAASYTGQMIELHRHEQFPVRFKGRKLEMMLMKGTVFTALGVILECGDAPYRLARAQLAAHRKGYFGDRCYYPIFNFVLRLLADFLQEVPLTLAGEALQEPIFNALYNVWNHPDPQLLQLPLLAACDFHTRRCTTGNAKLFYEFEERIWTRTPFEILLVLRLRLKLGLENPELDHPLMNSALGMLPAETPFEPDGLVARVRARMVREGYDEDAIFTAVVD